jgi:hypothetical protein
MYSRQANNRIRNHASQPLEVPRSNYAYLELFDKMEDQKQDIQELKRLVNLLIQQNIELKVSLLEQKNTGHFTIEDIEKYFDISSRLQQQDRTAKKLGHIKKKEGAKILYTEQHIREYFANEFEEHKAIKR